MDLPINLLVFCIVVAAVSSLLMTQMSATRNRSRLDAKLPEIIGNFAHLHLTPLLHIGDAEIDARHITDLSVSPHKLIVINDSGRQLIAFTPEGTRSHRIGREGGQPGEYLASQGSLSLDWVGDSLVVRDTRLDRATLFVSATGEYLRMFPLREWITPGDTTQHLERGLKGLARLKMLNGSTVKLAASDGTAIGSFNVPMHDDSIPGIVRDNHLYLVNRDREGVQSIQVYKLT